VSGDVSRETPAVVERLYPRSAAALASYAELLATEGVVRGLIGPREVPRLWDRHLLNCAVVERVIDRGAVVADVGSGAGLPGLVLAIVRPDLRVTLIEPLLRRTTFLEEVVEALGLENVTVTRSRAEDLREASFDVVVSRAVAPLGKLAAWCLPLCRPEGRMVAMKGSSAEEELAAAERALDRLRAAERTIQRLGVDELDQPTTVVSIVAGRPPAAATRTGRRTGSGR
jgi:16S rRNA (guanine527-N7)-methyltransferase